VEKFIKFLMSFIRFFMTSERGSFQITTAFVENYKSNVHHLGQQRNARLFGTGRQERQTAKTDYYERMGLAEANDITERHGDTVLSNTPHSRRAVTLIGRDYADMIDNIDRVKLLINPDDHYVQAAVSSINRKKDDVFIAAAFGNAAAGESGTTVVALPSAQKIVCTNAAATALAPLNVKTLRKVVRKFDESEIDEDGDEMYKRYFCFNGAQKESLLGETEVTSADYNSVRALVMGEIDTFLGMKFIRSERLPVTAAANAAASFANGTVDGGADTIPAGSDRLLAYIDKCMISATGIELFVDIGPRRDKKVSTQVYVMDMVGSTRLEEEGVIEIQCAAVA